MKIVYRAANITEAEIVRSMLMSNGIEAFVSGYYLQGGVGELAPTDLAKVVVSDEDYDKARRIIQGYADTPVKTAANRLSAADHPACTPRQICRILFITMSLTLLLYFLGE